MTHITFKGSPIETVGELPKVGSKAPKFKLSTTTLANAFLEDYLGKKIVLNIFPSLDTSVCAASVRRFNKEASELKDTVVLCISADLPFAHKRFCEAEGLNDVIPLSTFRDHEFGHDYGVTIANGPLRGLLSRAVVILGKTGRVVYTEQVPEIAQDPNFEAALTFLSNMK
ncbi:MAG: thiol peroxidase [Nitrospinota bacterium]|nr:thiol peroxidase [Nitrospinota bacterium]